MKVKFIKKGRKLSEKDIEVFEKENEMLLPEDYKKFLIKNNGGIPTPSTYTCPNNLGYNLIEGDRMSDFGIQYLNSLEEIYCLRNDNGTFSENMFCIGEDSGGNYYYISVSGNDKGKIYFWYHEKADGINLYLIANSFDDFINGFYDPSSKFEKFCDKNNLKGIIELLENGLDVNSKVWYDYSLVAHAANGGHIEVMKLLLEKGANPTEAFNNINMEVRKIVLSRENPSESKENIIASIYELLEYIYSKGVNVNYQNSFLGSSVLMHSCGTGDIEKVKFLLSKKELELNLRNKESKTALEQHKESPFPLSNKQEILTLLENVNKDT
jgi:hypothetical protein